MCTRTLSELLLLLLLVLLLLSLTFVVVGFMGILATFFCWSGCILLNLSKRSCA